MKYLQRILEAKKDEIDQAYGIYVGDTVKTKNHGKLKVWKIEMWGSKPTVFARDRNDNQLTLGGNAFKDVEILDSPMQRHLDKVADEKKEKERLRKERAKNAMNKRKYEKLIRDWVAQLGSDFGDGDMYSVIADTVDNFMSSEPEAVAYVKRSIERNWGTETPRERIQWDMEAAS